MFGVDSATTYKPVLQYCPNRELRKMVWTQVMGIGSVKHATDGYSTKSDLEDIRHSRCVEIVLRYTVHLLKQTKLGFCLTLVYMSWIWLSTI